MTVQKPPMTFAGTNGNNLWHNAGLHPKKAIVTHIMEGSLNGCIAWFANPQAQASANYGIGIDGQIVCFVDPFGPDAPFANGLVQAPAATFQALSAQNPQNANYWTVSLEHEGHSGDTLTDVQLHSSAWLTAWLCEQFNIPADEEHLLGHYEIDSVSRAHCPGWDRNGWLRYEAAVDAFQAGPVPVPPQPAPEDPRIAQVRTVLSGLKAQVSTLESVLNKAPALIADAFERGSKGDA